MFDSVIRSDELGIRGEPSQKVAPGCQAGISQHVAGSFGSADIPGGTPDGFGKLLAVEDGFITHSVGRLICGSDSSANTVGKME